MKLSKFGSNFAVLTLALGARVAFAQPDQTPAAIVQPLPTLMPALPAPPAPRIGTPEQQIETDVRHFFDLLNALSNEKSRIHYEFSDMISGARIGFHGLDEWADEFLRQREGGQYRLDKIDFQIVDGDKARVKISYAVVFRSVEGVESAMPEAETLDLKFERVPWNRLEKWRIVPPAFERLRTDRAARLLLENVAYFASQRPGRWEQLRGEISVARLRKIALAALQFELDYDNQLVLENEFWPAALRPYLGREAAILVPGTATPYTFNDNLRDVDVKKIRPTFQTVLFYEGADEKPIFRYNGKAAILLVDGHVALMSPDEAKSLIWKP